VPHTPKGLAYRIEWGSLRYAANTAFLAVVFADYLRILDYSDPLTRAYIPGTRSYHLFNYAVGQIHYILGDGGRSYLVSCLFKLSLIFFRLDSALIPLLDIII
jgi:hypothetical protein